MTAPAPSGTGVEILRDGQIGVLALHRPHVRNAIDKPTAVQLAAAFDDFECDWEVRAVVLTGRAGFAGQQLVDSRPSDGDVRRVGRIGSAVGCAEPAELGRGRSRSVSMMHMGDRSESGRRACGHDDGFSTGRHVGRAKHLATGQDDQRPARERGRPRRQIDRDAVADAVAELFAEGGMEAVSILETANKLSISRATLYRTVPNKEDLLGILFERCARDLTSQMDETLAEVSDPGMQLRALIELQSEAVIQMRSYLPVFFDGGGLPADVYLRWRKWTRRIEKRWREVVEGCMNAGYLDRVDPVITTRLILGMLIWVCRWYRPSQNITAEEIANSTIALLHLRLDAPEPPRSTNRRKSS